ncbi:uncharacterized protein LOC122395666 isoform X2 [Colletes gigas]|uniref:uncharacterized protein LOC122395666 isoform X2 n=1 Tax=Colletes gigas TaxID=935657 RepID=UPI001C9AAAF5|nr:uncharacterized protein LOC122395666 isoform X2 [Colletes gigas]
MCNNSRKENNPSKQSRLINKLLQKSKYVKVGKDAFSVGETAERGPSIHTTRRMNVLNKIFMQHVTDLMSTGEMNSALVEKSIEITDLKITADFKLVNVFWIDNSTDTSDTEEVLRSCAFRLRHELSQLRIMGNVPPIQFVRCKHYNKLLELEKRFATADYGEDYIPNIYPFAVNHIVTSKTSANKNDSETSSTNLDSTDDAFYITLPVMKHDVFGLDHSRIMTKIKASLLQSKKFKLKQATCVQSDVTSSESRVQNSSDYLTEKQQQEQFSKFLKAKRKEQKMKHKKRLDNNVIYDLNEENEDDSDYDFDIDYNEDEYEEKF